MTASNDFAFVSNLTSTTKKIHLGLKLLNKMRYILHHALNYQDQLYMNCIQNCSLI